MKIGVRKKVMLLSKRVAQGTLVSVKTCQVGAAESTL